MTYGISMLRRKMRYGLLAGVVDGVCGLSGRVGLDDIAGCITHGGQFRLSGDDAFQDIRRALRIMGIECPSILRMDEFRMATIVDGCRDWKSAGHGLWHDEAPVVLKSRNNETVGGFIENGDGIVVDGSCEYNAMGAVLLAELFKRCAFRAVPN